VTEEEGKPDDRDDDAGLSDEELDNVAGGTRSRLHIEPRQIRRFGVHPLIAGGATGTANNDGNGGEDGC